MKPDLPKGFQASGIAAGIKKNNQKDLGLIYSTVPATVAGVFTKNQIKAAPVQLCMNRISSSICQAIIVNSGNANCCTGDQGMKDAELMSAAAAKRLGISSDLVFVASTGVIGEPMPVQTIEAAVPHLVKHLSPHGVEDLARAIMTTDTIPKVISKTTEADGLPYIMTGVTKGSGMIAPNMATMLCFIATDVQADSAWLQTTLSQSVSGSLNRITIDGDMSTNDTVLLMANGLSGVTIDTTEKKASFRKSLDALLQELARMLVKDGEGATKLVEIVVENAPTEDAARRIAETVAGSSLVKTAIFGEDANWGRIMAAVGRAKVPIDPDRIDIYFDDVQMAKYGMGCGKPAEAAATEVLKKPEFTIRINLNQGSGRTSMITCDLSVDYVKINADYRS